MNAEIIIAEKIHAPIIQQLAYAIWPKTYGEILGNAQLDYMLNMMYHPSVIEQQIESKDQIYSILYLDNTPIGFTSIGPYQKEHQYKLHKIYLLHNIQGKGLGKKLLLDALRKAKDLKASNLVLNVNRYNQPAILFYEKMGFKQIETVDISIGNGYLMEDYVYQIEL